MARIKESPRKRNTRPPLFTILIVCEGKRTERIYFTKYRNRDNGLQIEIPSNSTTDPKGLLDFANKKAESLGINRHNGSVWVVFDADRTTDTRLKDSQLQEFETFARRNNINLLFSNPSFEIWYLLHFAYTTAALSNKDLIERLTQHLPAYDKATCYFSDLLDKRETAIQHATRLITHHEEQGHAPLSLSSNPSTQVPQLIAHIREKTANRS